MSPRDLLRNPCWQGEDLGHPLPDSTHAVSVALPRWRDVIAYEENDPQCRSQLRAFYPRFALHPLVAEVAQQALAMLPTEMTSAESSAWPYPNAAAAQLAQHHCQSLAPGASTQIVDQLGLSVLIANAEASPHAKAFWQHAGLGASSRRAAISLNKEAAPAARTAEQAKALVIERLAGIYGCNTQQLSLHPSGMAALHTALRWITALRPGRPTLQIGFPYVDVLKLPQVVFAGSELLLDSSSAAMEAALDRLDPAAVIVELPSNPLLQCVDLSTLARRDLAVRPAREVLDDAGLSHRPVRLELEADGLRPPARRRPGQEKSAKFPTLEAHVSVVFHSFRLTFGRAIISRNGLEAWMLFSERARAEHSR